jgi:multicomponent Na+:H+ antiporter subunit D
MTESMLPLVAVAIPATAALAVQRAGRWENARDACTLTASLALVAVTMGLLAKLRAGGPLETTVAAMVPGVALRLRADTLGVVFAVLASILWSVTSVYSMGYMRGLAEHAQTRFYASFAAALAATMGVAFSANLLTLYLFYELLTLATYPLVAHKETEVALVASRKYLVYTMAAGVALLGGMGALYATTGTLEFTAGGIATLAEAPAGVRYFIFTALIAGFGVKAALLPLHGWLPSAMIAPTPVSALLHAVAVVKSGVFGCMRTIGYVFGTASLAGLGVADGLAYLAGATVLFGSVVALSQDNLKRRLAYSTISHLSYIVLGAALLSASGTAGAVLHLVNHALLKITLFFCAGAIYVTTGCDRVSQLAGIGRRMPLTMGAFAVGTLGLAGLPPFNGFISKWYLCLGGIEAGHLGLTLVLIVSGVLNIAYLFPIVYTAFFRSSEEFPRFGEANLAMLLPLLLTALASLLLGIWPDAGPGAWSLARAVAGELE